MKPKILIGCPVHDSKMYCFEDWIIQLQFLDGDYDIFLADNSKSDKVQNILCKYEIPFTYISPYFKEHFETMAESHNAVREQFLKGDYTHLLHLECDVFPPIDVIPNLLFHNVDVVTAPYMIGEGYERHLLIYTLEKSWFQGMQDVHKFNAYEDCLFIDGTLKQVQSCGIGCTLISKRVMEKIKFRYDLQFDAYPDSYFYYDLLRLKIPAYLDTSLLCNHRNKNWISNSF